jgi:predicted nucleotidyltransferase
MQAASCKKTVAFDYTAARCNIAEKDRIRREKNAELFSQATRECAAINEMIKAHYNPKRIYQWGSLLDQKMFNELSDIDIAVEGLGSAEKFFALYGEAEKLTSFSLDLVELEKINSVDAESIRKKGKIIYERQ